MIEKILSGLNNLTCSSNFFYLKSSPKISDKDKANLTILFAKIAAKRIDKKRIEDKLKMKRELGKN